MSKLNPEDYDLVNPQYIRWYDWLWFLIPISGIVLFVLTVEEREKRNAQIRTRG